MGTESEGEERRTTTAPSADDRFSVPLRGVAVGPETRCAHWDAPVDVGLVNSSRGIIFAGEESSRPDEESTYVGAAGDSAKRLKKRLNQYR